MPTIPFISAETIALIRQKSPLGLPNNPTQQRISPQTIKEFQVKYVLDEQNSIVAEINRVIGFVNTIGSTVDTSFVKPEVSNSEPSNKNKIWFDTALYDETENVIVSTDSINEEFIYSEMKNNETYYFVGDEVEYGYVYTEVEETEELVYGE